MADVLGKVAEHLRHLADREHLRGLQDGELLTRFQERRQADALRVLVERHQRLVLAVCRRVLGNTHDAEDAFQATFLLLVRKACSIRKRSSISSWLYGVAYRVATKARTQRQRRAVQERKAAGMAPNDPAVEAIERDLRLALAAEVERLPEKYRIPVVLCYLEDKSSEEAARLLGWPLGTLWGRLARARNVLRERLVRRGFVLSSSGLIAALAVEPSLAASPALVVSTVDAMAAVAFGQAIRCGSVSSVALELMEGVQRAMCLRKLQVAAFGLALGFVVAGIGWMVAAHGWSTEAAAVAQAEPAVQDFPDFPGKFVPADKPAPAGGKVVLYSRNRHGNYPLATYAFHLGLRGDNAQVANHVNLVFGNRTREAAFAGQPVDIGPSMPDDDSAVGAAGMDGRQEDAVDEFRVNCRGGSRNRIVDLGEVDFAKVAIPKEARDDPENAVDHALNIVPVKVGHVYVIHIHDRDRDGKLKNFYVKMKVLQHRDNDAVLLEWTPVDPKAAH